MSSHISTFNSKSQIIDTANGHTTEIKYVEMTGGEILINALIDQGVEVVFGYPGGVVLGVYDVIYKTPKFNHILVRHEQAGTHAADGYSRATGKTGVVLATSGPGATNTVTGIATAFMDSIPMVVFTGQVPSSMIGNDAFQEADIIGITRPITKHSYLVKDASELGDVIKEAFYIAESGRPGPVVIDLPKDMLFSKGTYSKSSTKSYRGSYRINEDNKKAIKEAADLIATAKKPLIYAGGGVVTGNAWEDLRTLAYKTNIPVTTTLMGLGTFPESHPNSLGMLGMHGTWAANMAIQECDVLIAVGARFDDRVTGRVADFATKSKKIHIDIDPACINKNVEVEVPIIGDVKKILPDLIELVQEIDTSEWMVVINKWRSDHPLRYLKRKDEIAPQYMIEKISEITSGDAIIVTDVGQHQMWAAQYYKYNHTRSWITSGGLGTMGFGFPAAMGAAIGCPDRTVFCITGDGGFQMTAMEIATAVDQKVPVKVAIMNNGYLGMVRQWQELFYGERYSHSHLEPSNPDFVKLAEAYGAVGLRATTPKELDEILKIAMEIHDRPVIMDIHVTQKENVYPMVPPGAAVHEMVDTPE
jgi:acetolactate synthase I/II/III large subunit